MQEIPYAGRYSCSLNVTVQLHARYSTVRLAVMIRYIAPLYSDCSREYVRLFVSTPVDDYK